MKQWLAEMFIEEKQFLFFVSKKMMTRINKVHVLLRHEVSVSSSLLNSKMSHGWMSLSISWEQNSKHHCHSFHQLQTTVVHRFFHQLWHFQKPAAWESKEFQTTTKQTVCQKHCSRLLISKTILRTKESLAPTPQMLESSAHQQN